MGRPIVRSRKAMTVSLLSVFLVSLLSAVAYQHGDEAVRLAFGQGSGFRTQSGHGTSTVDGLVTIVERTAGEYVELLEVARPFTVLDTTVETPLLTVRAHIDALGPNQTYIDSGYANITIDGLLNPVPVDNVSRLVANLTEQGFDLVDELTKPSPSPSPSPTTTSPRPSGSIVPVPDPDEPIYFEYVRDNDTRVLVIAVAPYAERVDVIVLETATFGGLHVTTTPFVVSHRTGNGTLLDLWVRNPVEATIGSIDQNITVAGVTCAQGECIPESFRDLQLCETTSACSDFPDTHIHHVQHQGGPVALPEEILHVWSEDFVHGGAGISVLGGNQTQIERGRWTGNPFAEGLTLHNTSAGEVAYLQLRLPSPSDPRVGFTIDGPLVSELAGPVQHDQDLDQFGVTISWGPIHLSNAAAYAAFDTINGLLVGTWATADGEIRAAHITSLADPEAILTLKQDAENTVTATIEAVQAELTFQRARIEATAGSLLPLVQGAAAPAERAVFEIIDLASGEAYYQVSVVEGAVGCGITTLGCIGFVIGAAGDVLEDNGLPRPPSEAPDPVATLEGLPIDSSEIIAYANLVSGTVLAYLPSSDAPLPCVDTTTPITCLLTTQPTEIAGAAVGFITGSVPAFHVIADDQTGTVGVYDASGNALAAYEDGTIRAAGHTAILGESPLLTVTTPTGRTLCLEHTFDAAEMLDGAWPSIGAGCDGIEGRRITVQPGAQYSTDANGRLVELTIYDPVAPGDFVLYYYDDGDNTLIAAHESTGIDPVSIASTFVRASGNPVTSTNYRIELLGQGQTGRGVLQQVTILRDAWHDTERVGRTLLPGAAASVVFDVTHGPDVDPHMTDGRNTLTAGGADFEGGDWLSGLASQTLRIETLQEAERIDMFYRLTQPPTPSDASATLNLIGYNATTGKRTYEASVPAAQVSGFQTGALMHFTLGWTTRHGPVSATVIDDHTGNGYRYKLDTDAPNAALSAPTSSTANTFTVGWSGSDERGSGLGTFYVQSNDGTGWSAWIGGRHVTEPLNAKFTGQPGKTYQFRAQACDQTSNCGPWSSIKSTTIASTAAPPPAGPTITPVAPTQGATVSALVAIQWSITAASGTEPIATIEWQKEGTTTWTSLYSGHRTSTTWDTYNLYDGSYTLRYTVRDGARSDTDSVTVQVDNGRPEPKLEIGTGGTSGGAPPLHEGPEEDGHTEGKKKRSPGPALPLLVIALLSLLAVARRRRS